MPEGRSIAPRTLKLALCGDVMIGRGVDQMLPHPCDPILYEDYAGSAVEYVALAERVCGPIARPVDVAYPWGDALEELARAQPDARIVNLETAITRSGDAWPGKGIHYRVSPENAAVLSAARIDVCALANNHVLDWGRSGLAETVATLDGLGIRHAGAGRDASEAEAPAVVDLAPRGRLLVFAFASTSSGVPAAWAAAKSRAGVALLPDLSLSSVDRVAQRIAEARREGDCVVASIHWGDNWGFAVSDEERRFARALVERGGVDVVHGHSSHHVKGIEVHRGRPILYGCGDLLDDYEGISGYEEFRGDLGLVYLVTLDAALRELLALEMVPTRVERLRVRRASSAEVEWLASTLSREGQRFGTSVARAAEGHLVLRWG
ncbi:MAG TPA: CapA family protein [Myxococcota bacterium]|jgi:poly-gamma-glutamate synthesis protein (capsule biosynthesis protein)|nr:CapA family protein [Myxococcota bacterium]